MVLSQAFNRYSQATASRTQFVREVAACEVLLWW